MKMLLFVLVCVCTACGGSPFTGLDSLAASGAGSAGVGGDSGGDPSAGQGGSNAGSSGASGVSGAETTAGASGTVSGQAGSAGIGSAGDGGSSGSVAGMSGQSGSAGAAGSSNCSPLSCRNLDTGAVYCGVLTNVCGDSLDCGTTCFGAGTCGNPSDSHLCTATCKQPKCINNTGNLICGVQSNACGDSLDCGTVFGCDGSQSWPDGHRTIEYPYGRCGQVPDGCGGFLSCGECPSGTQCGQNGICG